jgi:hypothetical protein
MNAKQLRGNIRTAMNNAWRKTTRISSALTLLAGSLFCSAASAQTITVDGSPADWPAVLASNTILVKGYKVDAVNSKTDDGWTMGSQPVDAISGWHWKAGNVNDKTDIGNTGYAIIGHNLYFFADLHADNGDASVGLWLLKAKVGTVPSGTFSGAHTEGDLLVSLAFTNGHAKATPTIYRWTGGALTLVTVGATVAGAATNTVSATSPWPYTPKSGSAGTYPATTFFEGFINLDSVQGAFDPCIGTFLFQTWESQSEHAALSDLVIGGSAIITATASDTMVCTGHTVPLTGTPAGGTWSGYGVVAGTNTFDATGISPGTYTVTYWFLNPGGCPSSANATVRVKSCMCGCMRSGFAATEPDDYSIYPNPSTGTFAMYLPPLESDAVAIVVDIYGRVVDKRTITKSEIGQELIYDINLRAGMYFVRVENSKVHYSDKMLVK